MWFEWDTYEQNAEFNLGRPITYTFKNTSDITEVITVETRKVQNNIAINEVKTWYGSIKPTNSIMTTGILKGLNKDGEEEEIGSFNVDMLNLDEECYDQLITFAINSWSSLSDNKWKITYPDETWEWNKSNQKTNLNGSEYKELVYNGKEDKYENQTKKYSYNTIFTRRKLEDISKNYEDLEKSNYENGILTLYKEEDCLNLQFNWTLYAWNTYDKGMFDESDPDPINYNYTKMTSKDSNIKSKTMYSIVKEELIHGSLDGGTVDKNAFLGLLCNNIDENGDGIGEYKKGASFVPKSNGGKVVEYNNLYGGTSKVGGLLQNSAEQMFELLEQFQLQGLADIMRYLLYEYSNQSTSYGVEEFSFSVFDKAAFTPVD